MSMNRPSSVCMYVCVDEHTEFRLFVPVQESSTRAGASTLSLPEVAALIRKSAPAAPSVTTTTRVIAEFGDSTSTMLSLIKSPVVQHQ